MHRPFRARQLASANALRLPSSCQLAERRALGIPEKQRTFAIACTRRKHALRSGTHVQPAKMYARGDDLLGDPSRRSRRGGRDLPVHGEVAQDSRDVFDRGHPWALDWGNMYDRKRRRAVDWVNLLPGEQLMPPDVLSDLLESESLKERKLTSKQFEVVAQYFRHFFFFFADENLDGRVDNRSFSPIYDAKLGMFVEALCCLRDMDWRRVVDGRLDLSRRH